MGPEFNLSETAGNISLLILDVDGVLTSGEIVYDSWGREIKSFSVYDGLGVGFAVKHGLKTILFTSRKSRALKYRAKDMGIKDIWTGWPKVEVFEKILKKYQVPAQNICFVGDDLIDIEVMKRVGLPVAVNNAVPEVKSAALYITSAYGGRGAVREVVELIMKAKGIWQTIKF